MLAVFAEYERELIREWARDSRRTLADAGKWPGGAIPYRRASRSRRCPRDGYSLPIPNLRPWFREMVPRLLGGESFRSIARWLNAEGYPPSRDIQRLRREAQHAPESGQEPPPEVIKAKAGWSTPGRPQAVQIAEPWRLHLFPWGGGQAIPLRISEALGSIGE